MNNTIQVQIGELNNKIYGMEAGSDEWAKATEQLTGLYELQFKIEEAQDKKKFKPDWNLLMNGALSLATILLVLNYEENNIITSKGWAIATKWIGKGK